MFQFLVPPKQRRRANLAVAASRSRPMPSATRSTVLALLGALALTIAPLEVRARAQTSETSKAPSLLPGQLAVGGPRFLLVRAETLVPLDVARTSALTRRVTVDFDGVPARDALRTIAKKAGFELLFSDQLVPARTVRMQAKEISVAAALTDILLGAGVDVVFTAQGTVGLANQPP